MSDPVILFLRAEIWNGRHGKSVLAPHGLIPRCVWSRLASGEFLPSINASTVAPCFHPERHLAFALYLGRPNIDHIDILPIEPSLYFALLFNFVRLFLHSAHASTVTHSIPSPAPRAELLWIYYFFVNPLFSRLKRLFTNAHFCLSISLRNIRVGQQD